MSLKTSYIMKFALQMIDMNKNYCQVICSIGKFIAYKVISFDNQVTNAIF
jgi:hypothetical protein